MTDDLQETDRECPAARCSATLRVEEGRLCNVYRCPECRFEGVREPVSVLVEKISAVLKRSS